MLRPSFAAFFAAGALSACADPAPSLVTVGGACMGTGWKAIAVVTADTPDAADEAEELTALIQETLDHVDAKLSTWKDTSDLSRLEAAPAGTPVEVAPVTLDVLELAKAVYAETEGAFDPTVGPAVDLWGFGADDAEGSSAPTEAAIERAAAAVDFAAITLSRASQDSAPSVTCARSGVTLDASAIAKGHAVDLAAKALLEAGVTAFFLEVGGEVALRGRKPGGATWVTGVVDPTRDPARQLMQAAGQATYYGALELTDVAMATSGDYNNVRRLDDGRTVAHAIDPRTARPIEHDLASVTVIAESCARADALATAALVLGPDAGLALLERLDGVEGFGLVRTENGLEERRTSGAPSVLRD